MTRASSKSKHFDERRALTSNMNLTGSAPIRLAAQVMDKMLLSDLNLVSFSLLLGPNACSDV